MGIYSKSHQSCLQILKFSERGGLAQGSVTYLPTFFKRR
jgi:hypothetical protein